MENVTRDTTKKGESVIGLMIQERLKSRIGSESGESALSVHPDEDTITAFVEGRMETDESTPVVSHLISCRNCRRATAELVRLESQLGEVDETGVSDETPGRLREFLDGLAARIIPTEEDVVFAYQNPETDAPPHAATESESTDSDESESKQK